MSQISEQAREKSRELMTRAFSDEGAPIAAFTQAVSNACREATDHARGTDRGTPDIVAALAPFILPEPPDPLLIEARRMLAVDHAEHGLDLYHNGSICKLGAANDAIMAGEFDHHGNVTRYIAALRRGMELAGGHK